LRLWRHKPIEVACSVDEAWIPHLAATLHSLLEHEHEPVRVHLLAHALTDETVARLERMVTECGGTLGVHAPPIHRISALPDYVPAALWSRVYVAELLSGVDRVLSIDSDLLFAGPVDDLWRTRLRGPLLAAVANVMPGADWGRRHCAPLGVRPEQYFNTGVALLDLERMRREGFASQVEAFCRAHDDLVPPASLKGAHHEEINRAARERPELMWNPEQDVTNAVVAGRWRALHPRWNAMLAVAWRPLSDELFGAEAVEEALTNPVIRHFEGPVKPWHPDAESAAAALYRRHRDRTPWPMPAQVAQ
jgi:lipopolysaccharide biosynthesis glycosyltransferase